jgi:hypothetical protein
MNKRLPDRDISGLEAYTMKQVPMMNFDSGLIRQPFAQELPLHMQNSYKRFKAFEN